MRVSIATLLSLLSCQACYLMTNDYDTLLKGLYEGTVPLIQVEAFKQIIIREKKLCILDTRTIEEFNVSHIEGAKFIDFESFDVSFLGSEINKNEPIIVYCSVGYRSEKIGEQLQNKGYRQVYNLYGGLFQWVNKGGTIVDKMGEKTTKVHGFSPYWAKWLKKGEKVYE